MLHKNQTVYFPGCGAHVSDRGRQPLRHQQGRVRRELRRLRPGVPAGAGAAVPEGAGQEAEHVRVSRRRVAAQLPQRRRPGRPAERGSEEVH